MKHQKSFLNEEVPVKSTLQSLLAQSVSSHAMYESGDKDALLRLSPCRKNLFMLNNVYVIALYLREKEAEMSERAVGPSRNLHMMSDFIYRTGGDLQRHRGITDRHQKEDPRRTEPVLLRRY